MKRLLSLIITLALLIGCKDKENKNQENQNKAQPSEEEVPKVDLSGFEYSLNGESVILTKCTRVGQVIVPSTIEGFAVTTIGENAFYRNSGMTSLILPSTLTSIGNSAFRECIKITNVTIPPNVTSIGVSAFSGCIGLKTVQFLGDAPEESKYMFKDAPATLYFDPGKNGWDKPFGGRPLKAMSEFPN